MNIPTIQKLKKPSLELIKSEYNRYFMHMALSQYPTGTKLNMNNFLYLTFHKSDSYDLNRSIYFLYRKIKKATQPDKHLPKKPNVGMIAYYDYHGSRTGLDRTIYKLPKPDHCHAIIFARNIQERDDITTELHNIFFPPPDLHICQVTSNKKSLKHILSYSAKAFGHEYMINGGSLYDPKILPFSDERRAVKNRLTEVMLDRINKHKTIQDKLVLS